MACRPTGRSLPFATSRRPTSHSRIYVLPAEGSPTSHLVVSHPLTSSYWHGWSPDGTKFAFVSYRLVR
jgi:Tol biopolymer transport system component